MSTKQEETTTKTIDIEPTWKDILWEYNRMTNKDISGLLPACSIADDVRQAQKAGKKSITFNFLPEGEILIDIEENPPKSESGQISVLYMSITGILTGVFYLFHSPIINSLVVLINALVK